MTRIALKGPTGRGGASRLRDGRGDGRRVTGLDESQISTAVIHLAALLVSVAIVGANASSDVSGRLELVTLAIATCLGILRVLTVRKRLAPSTIVLDAGATVVLMLGTGAPLSPFYPFALAGIWWAAQLPVRGGSIISGAAFAAAFLILVVPSSLAEGLAGEALGKAALLAIGGVAADRLAGFDRRSLDQGASLTVSDGRPAIHEGLARVMHTTVVPVDGLLAAGRAGLTAIQTELLAYLMLGLANLEIADAIGVSEATVRYRLTRLYQALGVRGRKAAAARGRELGLDQLLPLPGER